MAEDATQRPAGHPPLTTTPLLDDELRATVECRLFTSGRTSGKEHEVRLWFAAVGNRVYILAGGRDSADWVRNVRAGSKVRLQIGGRKFEGRGRVVEGTVDDSRAREAIAAKYGTRWLTNWLRDSLPVAIDLEREDSG